MAKGKRLVTVGLMVVLLGMPAVTGLGVRQGQAQAPDPRKEEADRFLKPCRDNLQQQQYEAAVQACQEAAENLRQRGNRYGEARAITNIGVAYLNLSQHEKAIGYFQQALPMFQAEKDQKGEAIVLSNLGEAHRKLSQNEQAISYYEKVLSLYRAIQDRNGEANTLNSLGITYRNLAQYEKAIGFYQQALAIYQTLQSRNDEANVLFNLGTNYQALSQYKQAIQYFQKALLIYQGVNNQQNVADTLANLGNASLFLSQYEQAIGYYQQALPIFQMLKDGDSEAAMLSNLGRAYESLSQHEKAIDYYQQAISSYQTVKDRNGEAEMLNSIGIAYGKLSQYERALSYFQQALPIFQSVKSGSGEARTLRNLGLAYQSLSQYEEAITYYQQALSSYQTLKDRNWEAKLLNLLGNAYRTLSQYEQAIAYYQQALPIFQTLKNRNGEAEAMRSLGVIYDSLSQYERAISYYEKALPIFQAEKDQNQEAIVLSSLGKAHQKLSQHEPAVGYYEKALSIYQAKQDRGREVLVLNSLKLSYTALKQYDQVLLVLEQSLVIAREQKDYVNARSTVEAIVRIYEQMGQPDKAAASRQQLADIPQTVANPTTTDPRRAEAEQLEQEYLAFLKQGSRLEALKRAQQAAALYRELQDLLKEAQALGIIGIIYVELGNLEPAVSSLEKALEIARKLESPSLEQSISRMLAFAHQQLSDPRRVEAKRLAQQGSQQFEAGQVHSAIHSWEQALNLYREVKDRFEEADKLRQLGVAYGRLGQYQKQIELYQQSLAIAREMGNREQERDALTNLGGTYGRLGQYERKREFYQQSLAIARELGDRQSMGTALHNLSGAYGDLGQHQQAIDFAQQSRAIFREIRDKDRESLSLAMLGVLYGQLEQYQQAIEFFQQFLVINREIGNRRAEGGVLRNLGIAYFKTGQDQKTIEFLQQSLAISREISDRSGEGDSLEALGTAYLYTGDAATAETLLYEAMQIYESLRPGLTDDQKVSIFETQAGAYQALQQALIAQGKLEQALEVAERGRARAFVELLAAKQATTNQPLSVKSLTITEIKQIAKDQNATLVQYSLIDDEKQGESVYIWVVKPTGDIAFQQVNLKTALNGKTLDELVLGGREDIGNSRGRGIGWQEDTAVVNSAIAQVTSQANQAAQHNPNLQTLHEVLIAPIAQHLPTDPNQRVIFVPQGGLFLVPFPALQAKDLTYLIDKHTILTAPAIQVLQLTRQQRHRLAPGRSPLGNALIVGNPVMPPLTLVPGKPPTQLSNLPESAKEATAIAPLLKATALIGAQATKSTVVKQMQTARLIHLATHGIYDSRQGLQSGVVLAADGTGQPNDGLLTAGEILDLKLQAELVVLSACDTGRGKITGDGVIGLSRSLISAGVPSVVVSLWAVDDGATSELMQAFYQQLQQPGMDKAQALRQAMLATRAKHPGVAYWAAFTLIGEAE